MKPKPIIPRLTFHHDDKPVFLFLVLALTTKVLYLSSILPWSSPSIVALESRKIANGNERKRKLMC